MLLLWRAVVVWCCLLVLRNRDGLLLRQGGLDRLGLPTDGDRAALVERLTQHLSKPPAAEEEAEEEAKSAKAAKRARR